MKELSTTHDQYAPQISKRSLNYLNVKNSFQNVIPKSAFFALNIIFDEFKICQHDGSGLVWCTRALRPALGIFLLIQLCIR